MEDDDLLGSAVQAGLEQSGYTVDWLRNGAQAAAALRDDEPDLLVLDLGLPEKDGLTVLEELRERDSSLPVLILTARDTVEDRIAGLDVGADDYLVKPFAFSELTARLDALIRRMQPDAAQPTRLVLADLEMDLLKREARRGGKTLDLKPTEFRLLEYLLRHRDQVVTRTMLLEGVWDYHFDPQTNVIDVHISRLRAKLDRDFDRPLLHTVRGAGYRLGEA